MTIVDNEFSDLETSTGPMRTFVFRPAADGLYPGVLLFSEIFQVTEPIRRAARMMAGHGFIVAVPEIYHEYFPAGKALAYTQEGADKGNELKTTKEVTAYDSDARAGLEFLTAHSKCTGRLGVMGFCIGGHLAVRAAMNDDVRACASFYPTDIHKGSLGKGKADDTLERMAEIEGELQLIWGQQDPHIPSEGRRTIYDRLLETGRTFTWHEFNGQHAFMRDEGNRYDPALALQCYQMTVDLFRRRLGEGDRVMKARR